MLIQFLVCFGPIYFICNSSYLDKDAVKYTKLSFTERRLAASLKAKEIALIQEQKKTTTFDDVNDSVFVNNQLANDLPDDVDPTLEVYSGFYLK